MTVSLSVVCTVHRITVHAVHGCQPSAIQLFRLPLLVQYTIRSAAPSLPVFCSLQEIRIRAFNCSFHSLASVREVNWSDFGLCNRCLPTFYHVKNYVYISCQIVIMNMNRTKRFVGIGIRFFGYEYRYSVNDIGIRVINDRPTVRFSVDLLI